MSEGGLMSRPTELQDERAGGAGKLFRAAKSSIQSVSIADAAEAQLRTMLFNGDIEPGQELKDTMLAEEFGIARPTVRTVVQRLVAEGLLERRPGHSAHVRTVTVDDVEDLYRVRRLIEFEAVRIIIAEGRTTTAVDESLNAFRQAGETWGAGPDADAAFHTAVVHAAGSPRLSRAFNAVSAEMRLMVGLLRTRYSSLSELFDEHSSLLHELAGGDVDEALRLWADHIDDAKTFLTESLK